MVGAEYLTATGWTGVGAGYYYEVEFLASGIHHGGLLDKRSNLQVGIAGTNLNSQCSRVGEDACSWSFNMQDRELNGDKFHR